jgi:hypothetical protein
MPAARGADLTQRRQNTRARESEQEIRERNTADEALEVASHRNVCLSQVA